MRNRREAGGGVILHRHERLIDLRHDRRSALGRRGGIRKAVGQCADRCFHQQSEVVGHVVPLVLVIHHAVAVDGHELPGHKAEVDGLLRGHIVVAVVRVGAHAHGLRRLRLGVPDAFLLQHQLINRASFIGVVVTGGKHGQSHILKHHDLLADHFHLIGGRLLVHPVQVAVQMHVAEACLLILQYSPAASAVAIHVFAVLGRLIRRAGEPEGAGINDVVFIRLVIDVGAEGVASRVCAVRRHADTGILPQLPPELCHPDGARLLHADGIGIAGADDRFAHQQQAR